MINIRKVSGVISVQENSNTPNYFYGAQGTYTAMSNNTTILIFINLKSFQVELSDLRVNGQAPSSLENAFVLLNAVFGT